ncbi:hypothetical protein CHC164_13480 [Helicobacter pylori]
MPYLEAFELEKFFQYTWDTKKKNNKKSLSLTIKMEIRLR